MACQKHCCVFSRGEFYIRKSPSSEELCEILCVDNSYPYKKLGNISSATIELESSVFGRENEFLKGMPDSRIEFVGADITITLNCVSKENLYRAFHSSVPEDDVGSFVDDFCIDSISECDFFKFSKYKMLPGSLTVYLRDATGEVVEILIPGVDYKLVGTGIEIIRDDIDTSEVSTLRLSYAYNSAGFHTVDLLSKIQGFRSLYFKGTNYDGGSEATFDVDIPRVLFAPTNQMELISNGDFMTITLTGRIEKSDDSWFKITKQEN